ncbi:hypothetical protein GLAREA_10193 [Glarea lozoyensis ATCC 20868]|uniref:Uncharacterized protein n=2 Tax=Glarea lozoyensis TaxID=101852 RepID=S3DBK5_GLAL2|nr:uncharacterized protein GLAREA_10193 [Glarea lozoyensis ATCC 20868]EPE34499.1 hypothetical protein GLAREA_10193 [Glarea lozoyensis ATCC 20868]
MAKQKPEIRRLVDFNVKTKKSVNDTPIAIDLLNRALERRPKTKSNVQHIVQDKVKKSALKRTHEPKTVSVAGLFRKHAKPAVRSGKKRKEPTPEPGMMDTLLDGIDQARTSISDQLATALSTTHGHFKTEIARSHAEDENFREATNEYLTTLGAPLAEEEVETITKKNGKCITAIVNMGQRTTEFGTIVEIESAKLKELWKQWDDLQNEYLEQGVEVFGPEKFGEAAELVKGKRKGFKMEMELIDGEFSTTVQELKEEIEDLSKADLQKMKSSEKELEIMIKREQAKMLASIAQADY